MLRGYSSQSYVDDGAFMVENDGRPARHPDLHAAEEAERS
jgi:hypothetical protein